MLPLQKNKSDLIFGTGIELSDSNTALIKKYAFKVIFFRQPAFLDRFLYPKCHNGTEPAAVAARV